MSAPTQHLPAGGWYLPMRVFVPDRANLRALVGPFASADEAREAAPAAERGVLHVDGSTLPAQRVVGYRVQVDGRVLVLAPEDVEVVRA